MPLIVTDCTVSTNSITISFSDTVVHDASSQSATNPGNYSVFDANSVDFHIASGKTIAQAFPSLVPSDVLLNSAGDGVTFDLSTLIAPRTQEFQPGDYVIVVVRNVQSAAGDNLEGGLAITGGLVPDTGTTGRITRDVEDAISYPILTEEVSYRPSPVGIPTGGPAGFPGGGGGNLGQIAAQAVTDVLGWKSNSADPKGFVGALTQAFTLTDVEGHIESTWTPRTYAVQTDLGGGITGAQASLYLRAKNALDSALPLLDGLYPLDPEADPEYVKALREMARSQMTEIVKELGVVGLPSILRIDTYFGILLGQNPANIKPTDVQFDPDEIGGTLGELRDVYGIYFAGNQFNNSVEDEQDITNFRVISDYMTSLMQSWIANRDFFIIRPNQQAFFGTQLVLISRQFTTIAETVNEVRFALDSVFIGPNERQTLLLEFSDPKLLPAMFLEDVLKEVESFAIYEGPRLLRDGGKISVTNNVLPVVESLQFLINQAHAPTNIDVLPDGFKTARVRNALDDLGDQLQRLLDLILQVTQEVPPAEDRLAITRVTVNQKGPEAATLSILGTGFHPVPEVILHSTTPTTNQAAITVEFFSAQRIDVTFDPSLLGPPAQGSHDIEIKNPDGQSATLTNAFYVDSSNSVKVPPPVARVGKGAAPANRPALRTGAKRRQVKVGASRIVRTVAPSRAPGGPDLHTAALNHRVAGLEKGQHELRRDLAQKFDKIMEQLGKKEHKSKQKSE
jgi:hypothetical protein